MGGVADASNAIIPAGQLVPEARTKLARAARPEGVDGPGFFAGRLEELVGLARKNSIWPLPFATSGGSVPSG
jgi:NADH:ubiquinone oxidoreductase subunit B-like Fe-S oxidoreductase